MYKQHFFLAGKLLATASRGPVRVHEDVIVPHSILFLCRRCGATYAQAPVDNPGSQWIPHTGLCGRHPPTSMSGEVPGSIWRSWDKDFLDALPVPVLQYEFDRHFEAFERLNNHVG